MTEWHQEFAQAGRPQLNRLHMHLHSADADTGFDVPVCNSILIMYAALCQHARTMHKLVRQRTINAWSCTDCFVNHADSTDADDHDDHKSNCMLALSVDISTLNEFGAASALR